MEQAPASRPRVILARAFTWVEDIAYVVLGILLATSALTLLGTAAYDFVVALRQSPTPGVIVNLLDRLLLVLMVIELLYTVEVSFREHALVPEPFLIVGMVAATRRILVLTAEVPAMLEQGEAAFRVAMFELGVLTAMIVAFVASLLMLRIRGARSITSEAKRSGA